MSIKNLFTKKDLYIAYKKVKYELYNDKNSIATLKLYEYENDLNNNINKLFVKVKHGSLLEQELECEDFYEIPKSFKTESEIRKIHFFSSDISHHEFNPQKTELKFRKVINASIDFHILSALWILKIGQFIDEKFNNDIYGSRLSRIKPIDTSSCEFDLSNQPYNDQSSKIFESYHHKYQAWRNNSFQAIRELHKTSSVIAVTMDITSFYHNIILKEFTNDNFYNKFGLLNQFNKNPQLKIFHESFIKLLENWNNSIESKNGLPIGLSASSVLANAVMKDFDEKVKINLAPTYYGRYVDDILLVFPDNGNLNCGEKIIEYFINKELLTRSDTNKDELKYKDLTFKEEKQKIFYLDKNADLSILDGIEAEINSVSSEWRFLPDIADDNSSLLQKVVGFYSDGEEFNDALRKIDATTIKRLGLSLLVSHSHSLNQYIGAKNWEERRFIIYDLIENHIFIPKNLFENYTFLSKMFRLMIHSGDGERAYCFVLKIFNVINNLKCVDNKKSSNEKGVDFEKFQTYHFGILQEVLYETLNIQNNVSRKYYNKIREILNLTDSKEKVATINASLIMKDLAFDSLSKLITEYVLTKNEKCLFVNIQQIKPYFNAQSLDICITRDLNHYYIDYFSTKLSNIIGYVLNKQTLIFPTRLFTPLDISIILPSLKEKRFIRIVNSLRGTNSDISNKKLKVKKENINDKNLEIVNICNKKIKNKKSIDIAITNFEVKDEYWKNSIIKKPIKTLERFTKIQHIVNESVKRKPNYLVFPELSIPQEWAWLISQKLLSNNISLITGVEYIHTIEKKQELSQKIVHNSVMMFLVSDNIGFNYMKYFRQDKLIGAYQESIDLNSIANIILKPDEQYKDKKIYNHGEFYFSSLICNELTDIENRFKLRGNIDCLFAIEWNKDIKSFNALVESSSLDIHSYVVQVNNRNYGDSRIRAPYKNEYNRDIVQVKGGKHDYLIIGEINIEELREFQSHNISPTKGYKPVPTGFKMLEDRKKWSNYK